MNAAETMAKIRRFRATQMAVSTIESFTPEQLQFADDNLSEFKKRWEKLLVDFLPQRSTDLTVRVDFSKDFSQTVKELGMEYFPRCPYFFKGFCLPKNHEVKNVDAIFWKGDGTWSGSLEKTLGRMRLQLAHPLVLLGITEQFPAEVRGSRLITHWDEGPGKRWILGVWEGGLEIREFQIDLETWGRVVTTSIV